MQRTCWLRQLSDGESDDELQCVAVPCQCYVENADRLVDEELVSRGAGRQPAHRRRPR